MRPLHPGIFHFSQPSVLTETFQKNGGRGRVLPQLLQIQGGEAMGREVEVEGVNVVGMDVEAEVVVEDVEVVVASMLGVIGKVKAADCPVKQITLVVRSSHARMCTRNSAYLWGRVGHGSDPPCNIPSGSGSNRRPAKEKI